MFKNLLFPRRKNEVSTIHLIGDSVFDCGRYNVEGLTPGQLLTKNRDDLFPEFTGRDLARRDERRWSVQDIAQDGAIAADLELQLQGRDPDPTDLVVISVGGNDFLQYLYSDDEDEGGIDDFIHYYGLLLQKTPGRKLVCNIYDPFFGQTMENQVFYRPVPLPRIRANYEKMNRGIERLAAQYGYLVNLRDHFLTGNPSWFEKTIEPSLRGASEVRNAIWSVLENQKLL